MSQDTFFKIYDKLESRLRSKGTITTGEAWAICGGSYHSVAGYFRQIMNSMVEQKKAVKIKNGQWNILKPDK